MYLLAYNHLLLGEEGGDQEGELRDAFSTVSSSTLKHIAQHTLSILWGWGGDTYEGTEKIILDSSSSCAYRCCQANHRVDKRVDHLQEFCYPL